MKTFFNSKKLLATFFLFASLVVNAQNPYWLVPGQNGNYYQMQPSPFTTPNPIPSWGLGNWSNPDFSIAPNYAYNMIADPTGNPLFYVIDGNVLDKNADPVDILSWTKHVKTPGTGQCTILGNATPWSGDIIGAGGWFDYIAGFSEVCIVPNPANCQQYFIFTAGSLIRDEFHNFADQPGVVSGYGGIFRFFDYAEYPFYAIYDLNLTHNYSGTPMPGNLVPLSDTEDAVTGSSTNCTPTFVTTTTGPIINNTKELFTTVFDVTQPSKQDAIYYAATDVINSGGAPYNLVFMSDGNSIFCLKIDGSSLNTPSNWLIKYGSLNGYPLPNANKSHGFRAEMEVVKGTNGNYRVVVPFMGTNGVTIHAVEYSSSGQVIAPGTDFTLGNTGNTPYIHGLEFSPDGSKLFFSHEATTAFPNLIDYLSVSSSGGNITLNLQPTIPNIPTTTNPGELSLSQIETNTNSSTPLLYFATTDNFVSLNPNTLAWNTSVVNSAAFTPYNLGDPWYYLGFNGSSTAQKAFLLPDQIDGANYTSSQNSTFACCIFYKGDYDKIDYSTTSGQTQIWSQGFGSNPLAQIGNNSNIVTIGDELRIKSGSNITINNMIIKFSPKAKLIVEVGAKLTLTGCTLTVETSCGDIMWPGVQVWGNPNNGNQITQGSLTMTGTTVEHAFFGVFAGKNTYFGANPSAGLYNYSSIFNSSPPSLTTNPPGIFGSCGGGIIKATDCIFQNNQVGISFAPYGTMLNLSAITTCTFQTTQALKESYVQPVYFAKLNGVVDVTFFGNTFTNLISLTQYNLRTTGIFGQGSQIRVYPGGTPVKPNTFSNLWYGVFAVGTNGRCVSVLGSTFTDNYYGVYMRQVHFSELQNNTFNIYNGGLSQPNTFSQNRYGLYLDLCTGYKVWYNSFQRNNTTGGSPGTAWGVLVNNSGAHSNVIYHNTFTRLNYGSQAQLQNHAHLLGGTYQNDIGLSYYCNDFTTISQADIAVPASGGILPSGIKHDQGTNPGLGLHGSADNIFTHQHTNDFFINPTLSQALGSTYYYDKTAGVIPAGASGLSNTNPYCPDWTASPTPSNLDVAPSLKQYGCTSLVYPAYRLINPIPDILQRAFDAKTSFDNAIASIDGNQTEYLLALVTKSTNDPSILRDQLMLFAPLISNQVLIAYINSNNPPGLIKQVLLACAPVTPEVQAAVNASSLPTGHKMQINNMEIYRPGPLEKTYIAASDFYSNYELYLADAISLMLQDSSLEARRIGFSLMRLYGISNDREAFAADFAARDFVSAATDLNNVIAKEGVTSFSDMQQILLDNADADFETLLQQNTVLKGKVLAISNDLTQQHSHRQAHGLLKLIGASNFQEPIQDPSGGAGSRIINPQEEKTAISFKTDESDLYSFPNPFKESTIIRVSVAEKIQNAYVLITDLLGNQVAKYTLKNGDNEINFKGDNLNQEILFCSLIIDGATIKTCKLVLIK